MVILDIRLPPTHTDEGLRAALEIRERHPDVGVLVLSQYVEVGLAMRLLSDSAEGAGYLLKDRITEASDFVESVRRVADGGSAVDPIIVSTLLSKQRQDDPIESLTPREREVLELMATGSSNQGIADALVITVRAVEKYVSSIFSKLDLPSTGSESRRYMRREREERAGGKSPREALETAAATSGRAVMVSALTVIIAMSGMFITGEATFESFAVATVSVVAVEMLVSLLVLPAVLAWLGDRVEKGRIPFIRRRRVAGESGMWSSIVRSVMRRPLLSAGLATAVLVALAIPAFSMNMVQTGVDDIPNDLPVMKTYDRFTAAFPDKTNASEVVVESDDVRSGPTAAAIDDLVRRAEASDISNGPVEIDYSDNDKVAQVTIPTIGDGTDDASRAGAQ